MGNRLASVSANGPGNQRPASQSKHRGPDAAIAIDIDLYRPIVNQYLQYIDILMKYDKKRTLHPIEEQYNHYCHIYKRERILQFLWPQCVGIPLLHFDLDAHGDIDWWIGMYRPYVDAMLKDECQNDGGVFVLLGWTYEEEQHQTVLHFDIQNKRQTFFDPMGHYDEWMRDKSLATGYEPHYHESSWHPIQVTIESHRHESSPWDTCSAICILLLVCCRRFGTTDIHGMSRIIESLVYVRNNDISTIRYYLWLFYIELGASGTPLSDLYSLVGVSGDAAASFSACTAVVAGVDKNRNKPVGVPTKFPFAGEKRFGCVRSTDLSGMGVLCVSHATTAGPRRNQRR